MVGVDNTPDRIPEYTPCPDPDYPGGQASDYETFLTSELKPFIDSHYRTQPDAAHTGIMGLRWARCWRCMPVSPIPKCSGWSAPCRPPCGGRTNG